jgi:hypothetical protein
LKAFDLFLPSGSALNILFIFNELFEVEEYQMGTVGKKIIGVKAININEESAEAIEKMVDKAIREIRGKGLEILEIQSSSDYLIIILGEG